MTNTPQRLPVHTFHALEVSLELIRSLREPVASIRKQSPDLAKQLERAASSVAANVSEGNRRRGRDRGHLFRIAAGSADEVQTHLRVAEAWGYLPAPDIARSLALTDRVLAMLHRLA